MWIELILSERFLRMWIKSVLLERISRMWIKLIVSEGIMRMDPTLVFHLRIQYRVYPLQVQDSLLLLDDR